MYTQEDVHSWVAGERPGDEGQTPYFPSGLLGPRGHHRWTGTRRREGGASVGLGWVRTGAATSGRVKEEPSRIRRPHTSPGPTPHPVREETWRESLKKDLKERSLNLRHDRARLRCLKPDRRPQKWSL